MLSLANLSHLQLKRKNYQQQIHVHVNVHYTQIVIKQKQARFYETRKTVENFSYKNILPTSVSQKLHAVQSWFTSSQQMFVVCYSISLTQEITTI